MTERPPKESFIGHAGRLLYQPLGVAQAEDCGWHSARNLTQKGPCFKDLGTYKQWHSTAATPEAHDDTSKTSWQKTRRQKTWLLKSLPESRLGNAVVHELLSDAHAPQQLESDAPWRLAPFAIGELTDKSNAQGTSGTPFVALATGGANNILRLARLQQEEWRWDDDEAFSLNLLEISDHQPAVWEGGIGPIQRMKCVVDPTRYDPTRWLIVQWESETRVFQPEFGRYPIGPRLPGGDEASRIAVRSLFSLSMSETGGSPHMDASFNPNTRSKAAQLSLIDARGYWSIWDVTGVRAKTSRKPRVTLRKCGNIQDGVLRKLPFRATGDSDWHTILWVGGTDDPLQELEALDLDEEMPLHESQDVYPPLERSSTLLLGNSKLLRLLDLNTNMFLPDIKFVPETGLGRIIDVQRSPQDPRYIFVLTTSRLFVAGLITSPGLNWDQPMKHWSILLSMPHQRDSSGASLKFNVASDATTKGLITTLVTLYSAGNTWLDVFHISINKRDSELIDFYHEAINLGVSQNPLQCPSVQSIQLHPITVARKPSESPGRTARLYAGQPMRFYQLIAVDTQLNVLTRLCVSSANSIHKVVAPTQKAEAPRNRSREHKQLIRRLASRFIVPDYIADFDRGASAEAVPVQRKDRHRVIPHPQRFLKLVYEQIRDAFEGQGLGPVASTGSPEPNPFDAIQNYVQEAVTTGQMPVTTLFQFIRRSNLLEDLSFATNDWDSELDRLRYIDPSVHVLDLRTPSTKRLEGAGSSLADVYARLLEISANVSESSENSIWTEDIRPMILKKMACDLLLSWWGLACGRLDLAESEQPSANTLSSQLEYPPDDDDMLISSSPAPRTELSPAPSSQATSVAATPEESQGAEGESDEDPAMALLRAYTGTGRFVPRAQKGSEQRQLLDQWRVGADPADHVFDLDREKEVTPGMRRRARVLARESRKRRRAESLLQMSQRSMLMSQDELPLPPLPPTPAPSTQPAPQVHRRGQWSQQQQQQPTAAAMFSQSQAPLLRSDPITMSQPVPGAFAQRPKKRPKRKGGF